MTFETHLATYKYSAFGWKQPNLATFGYGSFDPTNNIHNSSNSAESDTCYNKEIKCCISVEVVAADSALVYRRSEPFH